MKYDFDQKIDRRNTYCAKLSSEQEGLDNHLYDNDYIYMQIADMDFACSEGIRSELKKVLDHNIYGYTIATHSYGSDVYDMIAQWLNAHHGLSIKGSNIFYAEGTLGAVTSALKAFTKPGEGVIINRPVYGPFTMCINNVGCHVVNSQLLKDDKGRYSINFEELEQLAADPNNTAYILCSPHNPVGRVWSEEELLKLHEICQRNHVLLISDEVHCDFVWGDQKFLSTIKVTGGKGVVMCSAFAKTFNLAGLKPGFSVVTDPDLLPKVAQSSEFIFPSPFTIASIKGACLYSEDWLQQMKEYVRGNIEAATAFFKQRMPKVNFYEPEGTYLLWLDFSKYGFSDEELHQRIYANAKVILEDGTLFDPDHGHGFQRLCLPVNRSRMLEGLERIAVELEK